MLIKALRHSLCDFVCEYYAFTAPLCEVPPELATEAALSIHEENMTSLNTSKGLYSEKTCPTCLISLKIDLFAQKVCKLATLREHF